LQIQLNFVSLGLAATTALTAGFFAYLYHEKQQPYLRFWTVAWCLATVHSLAVVLEPWLGPSAWLLALSGWLMATAALAFFWSARLYVRARPGVPFLISAAGVFAFWAIAYGLQEISISPNYGTAVVFLVVAGIFFLQGRQRGNYADRLMALAFLVWAPIPLLGLDFVPLGTTVRQGFAVLAIAPQLFAAVLMLMATYENETRWVENHLLALSDLNLLTSGLPNGEMQRILSEALERLLSVVHVPAGAFFLDHGEASGPTSVVSIGFDESFCRALQENNLDDYLTRLVRRSGGLFVVQDIASHAPSSDFDHEAPFLQFQRLAAGRRLHTVIGVTLQAKDQTFGALLLATPDSRRLTPAELQLLKALSHQIGIAIENSYLIRQTSRRSEELRVLNEIGCALSSMLDPDALLEKIFTEVRRLFEATSFFVTLCDPTHNQIRFELEFAEGVRLPKRTRPIGNHVTEYIMKTRQPLLIRDNFEDEMRRLGVFPLRRPGSFCGVPLIVCDRVIGVMAVRGPEERLFDEGHLELLRVLGSEASIAIENARLFREEQTKSRHLTLLNNISRDAISTLNPEEMLANIAEQLEKGLAFDHMGIAILDYASKEIVIQAEAGRRRGALNRRLALGASLVGQVARTARTCVVPVFAEQADSLDPVLEGSVSSAALPILHSDHLLGVLYVETAEPSEFSEEELLLLHTLAELISGALHNALRFQKAQEQAITDGLTGVKTHRFFMEALSAEWKRSARGGRSFALVLIDLDRFKFVNDFHGHLEGDSILQHLGRTLEQNCRRSDVVARYGGDEFVILMPETDLVQGQQLAQKLRSCILADPLLHEKNTTASMGIAVFPLHGSTPQELIQVADASMYLAKHQGGNAVVATDDFDATEARQWKYSVLEAYLGVTLKRLFSPGPEAFGEIHKRLEQFSQSLAASEPPPGDAADLADETAEKPRTVSAAIVETVTSLALAIDSKDQHTQGHSRKVAHHAALIAEQLGLEDEQIEEVRLGALLHDVGKVGVQASILNKNGPLNPDEWDAMKAHAQLGDKLLEPLVNIAHIRRMVRHHHEMFDGSGYPDNLAGANIPLGARIIAIADAYDTITSERIYKKARTSDEAVAELLRCAGTQFDPELVRVFTDAVEQRHQQVLESSASETNSLS
jgi:diguanylate cyclase (GGDEF)-like protein